MGSLIVNALTCYIEGWDQNKDLVDFKEYPNVNWPLNDYDQLMGESVDKDMCKQKCLEDCFCSVAINNDAGQCWKKRYPLSNGRKHPNINGTIALVKVPKTTFFLFYHRKHLNPAATTRCFTYKELEEATTGFKQILGRGAFGTVYKGVITSDTSRFVAVKKLDKVSQEGEKEFKTEVSVIGQTHHRNL
ncbi:Serine-threonine/tyrosine-protein kinase, catalytic domain, partial [Sesbania bispinosa]